MVTRPYVRRRGEHDVQIVPHGEVLSAALTALYGYVRVLQRRLPALSYLHSDMDKWSVGQYFSGTLPCFPYSCCFGGIAVSAETVRVAVMVLETSAGTDLYR